MRNYAKFCKIKLNDKKFQLNLTESGIDSATLFDKFFAKFRTVFPLTLLVSLGLGIYNFFTVGFIPSLILGFIGAGLIGAISCFMPGTSLANAYNAINQNAKLVKKLKKYYKEMRNYEILKQINSKNIKKQVSLTSKTLHDLLILTKKNDKKLKRYYKELNIKEDLGGLSNFAYDNLTMLQQTIDKFIFHNKDILMELCPRYEKFINDRTIEHYETLTGGYAYYDEYVWSAKHKNDIMVKNNCINKKDNTTYFNYLKEVLNLDENISNEIKFSSLNINDNNINKQKLEIENFKTFNNEKEIELLR